MTAFRKPATRFQFRLISLDLGTSILLPIPKGPVLFDAKLRRCVKTTFTWCEVTIHYPQNFRKSSEKKEVYKKKLSRQVRTKFSRKSFGNAICMLKTWQIQCPLNKTKVCSERLFKKISSFSVVIEQSSFLCQNLLAIGRPTFKLALTLPNLPPSP